MSGGGSPAVCIITVCDSGVVCDSSGASIVVCDSGVVSTVVAVCNIDVVVCDVGDGIVTI